MFRFFISANRDELLTFQIPASNLGEIQLISFEKATTLLKKFDNIGANFSKIQRALTRISMSISIFYRFDFNSTYGNERAILNQKST